MVAPKPAIFRRNITYKDRKGPTLSKFQRALEELMGGTPSVEKVSVGDSFSKLPHGKYKIGKGEQTNYDYIYRWKNGNLKKAKPFTKTVLCVSKGLRPQTFGGQNLFAVKNTSGYHLTDPACGKMAFVTVRVSNIHRVVKSAEVILVDYEQIEIANDLFENWRSNAKANYSLQPKKSKQDNLDSTPYSKL